MIYRGVKLLEHWLPQHTAALQNRDTLGHYEGAGWALVTGAFSGLSEITVFPRAEDGDVDPSGVSRNGAAQMTTWLPRLHF